MVDWQWIGKYEPPVGIYLIVWNCEYDQADIARYDGHDWVSYVGKVGFVSSSEISHWALPLKPTRFS